MKSNSSLNMVCEKILNSSLSQKRQPNPSLKATIISEPLLDMIKQKWGEELLGVILFGSAVRSEEREDSDIDLLLVLQSGASLSRKYYEEWNQLVDQRRNKGQIQPPWPPLRKISPHFVQLPKDPLSIGGLWYEVSIEGIILWQQGNEVQNILRNIRHLISEGKLQRKYSHGHPYWIKMYS